jgi:hypothetical protein
MAGHSDCGEQIEDCVLLDEVEAFRVQPDEMCAVFAAVAADAVIDAKQIRVGAIGAFPKRNTHFRNG